MNQLNKKQVQAFKKLKSKLPYQFIKAILPNAEGVSDRQIKAVFAGEITDLEIVDKVRRASLQTAAKYHRLMAGRRVAKRHPKKVAS